MKQELINPEIFSQSCGSAIMCPAIRFRLILIKLGNLASLSMFNIIYYFDLIKRQS